MKQVICISGKAQHGKDTTALITKYILECKGEKVLILHYADLLKYLCKSYFNWDGNKDDKGRTLLQYVGTDIVRKKEPNYWVDFVIKFLHLFEDEWDYVLIPDCRFPNEVDSFYGEFPFIHWRVVRPNFDSPLTKEQQNHPSETALDNHLFDKVIINNSTIEQLYIKLYDLINSLEN